MSRGCALQNSSYTPIDWVFAVAHCLFLQAGELLLEDDWLRDGLDMLSRLSLLLAISWVSEGPIEKEAWSGETLSMKVMFVERTVFNK